LLELISSRLTPMGVAYISYDTYPGWHPRLMLREMLQRHTRSAGRQAEAVSRARYFLEALVSTDARESGPNAAILIDDARKLLQMGDSYVAHEPLAEYLEPIYFEEFVRRLESHGLTYLAECRPRLSRMGLARAVAGRFPELAGDWVGKEQYIDFFMGSQFRRSLIAHASASPQREHDPALIERLAMRALCKPNEPIDLSAGAVVVFDGGATGTIGLSDPATKAIVVAVCRRWPELVSLDEALADARARLRVPESFAARGSAARVEICRSLMNCRDGGLIELRTRRMDFTVGVSERPVASPLVRILAAEGKAVPCRLHFSMSQLNPLERILLTQLDGTRDRGALVGAVDAAVKAGLLSLANSVNPSQVAGLIEQAVETSLNKLARMTLLIA
jgi:hypothetical protein